MALEFAIGAWVVALAAIGYVMWLGLKAYRARKKGEGEQRK